MALYFIDDSDYLEHYGILGMKWGVRKDQGSGKDHSIKSKRQVRKAKRQVRKATKKFNKQYKKGWIDAYNKGSDAMNEKHIPSINKKYEKYDFSKVNTDAHLDAETRKAWNSYVREIGSAWRKEYSNVLLSEFGEHPESGKAWVEHAPFMDRYDGFELKDEK